ncbi:sensor histidine kinase [Cuneatibacter caecimuris]|uniref:histidine kinase n=1 Tax=Cuneatibacter caecimuris TaxID=1796618 RepID=A0A4Q7P086_9FIRM|nr:HAMP domain-containing sensor histidine kinase [Cuneatibacter caecimuris]RZS92740.1 HAMP domain-containing protein [Cuneatibacter caecimuris]
MKHSLRIKITAIFVGVTALTIVVYWAVMNIGLEKFYMKNKIQDMQEAYQELDQKLQDKDLSLGELKLSLIELMNKSNISVGLFNESLVNVLTFSADAGRLEEHLISYVFGWSTDYKIKVLEQNNNYMIQRIDTAYNTESYMECWGYLAKDKYRFIMSTPVQSMKESAEIANQLISYVGICVMLISGVLLYFVTGKVTKPIRELTRVSERMSKLDFDARYTGKEKNEIGILGHNINLLSANLEETISELKSANLEMQKDLEQKQQIDDMRKEFISNVSHELKTPIALVQGYAEGLLDGVNDDPESQRFYCEVIKDEADKMNRMVRKLLTLTQLEFGDDQVEMERLDMVAVIRGVLGASKLMILQKEAVIDFPYTDPVYAWADELKVEEVITNYITNALNHLEGDRRIEIRIAKSPRGKVHISVFNTGKQIPEEDLDKVWIKFYKVDKARTREYGGNGIGLSIVKAIMESFRQSCGVKNREDGVEFWFELDGNAQEENQII